MTRQPERQGAEIIPFPSRRAGTKSAAREGAPTRDRLPADVSLCEFGSGWYHDEAMKEEARRRNPR